MTVAELNERMKAVKIKDTEILFRDKSGNTYSIAGMFYGIKSDGAVSNPQVGEEPNCVVVQISAEAMPEPAATTPEVEA